VLPGALLRRGAGASGGRRLAAVLPVRAPLLGARVPVGVLVPARVAQNALPSGSGSRSCARNHHTTPSHLTNIRNETVKKKK